MLRRVYDVLRRLFFREAGQRFRYLPEPQDRNSESDRKENFRSYSVPTGLQEKRLHYTPYSLSRGASEGVCRRIS